MDLQAWLDDQRHQGRLAEVRSSVYDAEVSTILEAADGRSSVRFHRVRGSPYPLVGNLLNTRADVARALRCPPDRVPEAVRHALRDPRPVAEVDPRHAPVLAGTERPDRMLEELPVIRQHEADGGRYVTAGVLVTRDHRTGCTDLSINRLQVCPGGELRTLVLPGRLAAILADAERRGEDLPVAVVVGLHPAVTLASQSPPRPDLDDLAVAARLGGTGLDVVRSPELGLPVPAGANVLLEGRFRSGRRAAEGPFGEFPLTYGPATQGPVIDLARAWRRDDAVYQSIQSGSREHFLLGGVLREAQIAGALRRAGIPVTGVRLPESGSCRFQAALALAPGGTREQARRAVAVAFETVASVKQVLVVDHDVDVLDDEQLGWAVATRVRPERDLVLEQGTGSALDPVAVDGSVTKLGVLAVVEGEARHRRMAPAPVPPGRVAALLAEAGLDRIAEGA